MAKVKKEKPVWVAERTCSFPELAEAVEAVAGPFPVPRVAEALGTSKSQATRLLGAQVDPRLSVVERLGASMGTLTGGQYRVRLVLERLVDSQESNQ